MNDRELADEIERVPHRCFTPDELRQIISALRRSQPEGEMVIPREDLIRWACCLEDADSRLGPYWLGAKRDACFKEAANEMRARLAGTFSCPHCGIATPHQHNVDHKGNLSAAEAEGRKS